MHGTDHEIHATLVRFLQSRTDWPTDREFQGAGLEGIRDEITQQGELKRVSEPRDA